MTRTIAVVVLLAIGGLLFELWHDSNDVALGGLVALATRGLDILSNRNTP